MDYRDLDQRDDQMPRKGKINRKNKGKKSWHSKDVLAEEIRYKRKVKYKSHQFADHSGDGLENEGWD